MAGDTLPEDAVWIDLFNPTPEEERQVETALGFGVPTADEMAEIETSSRLYVDNGAIVMTATLATGLITETPETVPVSFVLGRNHLVTVRYAEIRSFDRYAAQLMRTPGQCSSAPLALMGLIDAIVDRLADGLEHVGREVDQISRAAFRRAEAKGRQQRRSNLALQALLTRLGAAQDGLSKARESVVSLTRALSFLQFAAPKDAGLSAQIKTQVRDLASLADQASFIGSNLTFLLDATLGLISIEQNAIFKIFSVASIVFLPPTLVAGIYGMNFVHMPELGWEFGYPMALAIMLAAAVLPYAIFRWRGWL
ncbi:magnesium transporter CorA family protein [Sandarakinorhabdus oryzae]|uniref:magnesium transporter CorA family protein n=1 Tax=Sandarakinorhabdus oryzae TaxID=2675220 RepID=UPI0018CC5449|nr:magnesium transporter CorA family protein [Sandarakinorhabdus oryzae]